MKSTLFLTQQQQCRVCGIELTSTDYQRIYTLLRECLERWIDPASWRSHLLDGILRWTKLSAGMVKDIASFDRRKRALILSAIEHDWTGADGPHPLRRAARTTDLSDDLRFQKMLAKYIHYTVLRSVLDCDRDWYCSRECGNLFFSAANDELFFSVVPIADSDYHNIIAYGRSGRRPTERHRQFVAHLHSELAPMIGTSLATEEHISVHGLSPRRRQILKLIADGLPEKLIADQLGLRRPTVNQYTQKLFEHFGVQSRTELLAYLIQRTPVRRRLIRNAHTL